MVKQQEFPFVNAKHYFDATTKKTACNMEVYDNGELIPEVLTVGAWGAATCPHCCATVRKKMKAGMHGPYTEKFRSLLVTELLLKIDRTPYDTTTKGALTRIVDYMKSSPEGQLMLVDTVIKDRSIFSKTALKIWCVGQGTVDHVIAAIAWESLKAQNKDEAISAKGKPSEEQLPGIVEKAQPALAYKNYVAPCEVSGDLPPAIIEDAPVPVLEEAHDRYTENLRKAKDKCLEGCLSVDCAAKVMLYISEEEVTVIVKQANGKRRKLTVTTKDHCCKH